MTPLPPLIRRFEPSPIVVKEMRASMRSRRSFVALTFFLLLLAAISLLMYYSVAGSFGSNGAEAGRLIFGSLSGFELFMLTVMTPSLTASAIATEQQKQTLEMLMATPLTPGQVLRGKLLAAMSYVLLLMVASLPIKAIVFLFGGVTPADLLWWYASMLVLLFMLGAIGLLASTLIQNAGGATALAFFIPLVLFGVLPIIAIMVLFLLNQQGIQVDCGALALLVLHPLATVAAAVVDEPPLERAGLLVATLPFFGAMGLLFLQGAETRLAALIGQGHRRPLLIAALVAVMAIATLYILFGPVRTQC